MSLTQKSSKKGRFAKVSCQICKKRRLRTLMDLGPQPLCNRFVVDPGNLQFKHPLELGQCISCGLIQLMQPVPAKEISPRFEWLTYNEPEGHLDLLASIIRVLPGISERSTACGITYKDDSLLQRLVKQKIRRTWRIDPEKDLGIRIAGAGGETVLPHLTEETSRRLSETYGRPDIIIARHVLEHAPDTRTLLKALKNLVAPGGHIVFEVPDCSRSLKFKDYSMLWEEHILYFTPQTFQRSFDHTGYQIIRYESFPYPVENALVAITRPAAKACSSDAVDPEPRPFELEIGQSFGDGLKRYASGVYQYLQTFRQSKGKVAIFGAGHLACMYINLLGIEDLLEFVVDDAPHKQGLYMPGSGLPICGSRSLIDEKIRLCLLSLAPESERKVIQKQRIYLEQGGSFASIFPWRENRLPLENRKER